MESEIERAFEFLWSMARDSAELAVKEPEREYRFCERRWRFDFAWPEEKVAVECDGGQWLARGGRHARDQDREKLNRAAVLGWRVLRYSREMLERGQAEVIDQILAALDYRRV
jgi:very-short-patch-repair endonuclease